MTILHVDIDAFFASVEQLRNPRLEGKPVAVGSGVIASCSYEARRFGLRAGMPLRKARRLCPELKVIPGHAAIYRCFSERIFELCREYAPVVETYLDEAFCDLSGTERLYRCDLLEVAAELKARIRREVGLRVTIGLGRNRMLAKTAARSVKPDGLRRIEPHEEEAFLSSLPVSELPGVGPRAAAVFAKLNVRTVADLRLLTRSSLEGMFGAAGALLYERARGRDTRPVTRREIPGSISRETSFPNDVADTETIEGTLHYLLERAANTLRRLHLRAREVEVKIRYADGETARTRRRLPLPTQLDSELFAAAAALRRRLHRRRVALRLVGVLLAELLPDDDLLQLELPLVGFEAAAEADRFTLPCRSGEERLREERLLRSLDAIRERYGYSALVCGRSLHLLEKLPRDEHGFILRTPSLTL